MRKKSSLSNMWHSALLLWERINFSPSFLIIFSPFLLKNMFFPASGNHGYDSLEAEFPQIFSNKRSGNIILALPPRFVLLLFYN